MKRMSVYIKSLEVIGILSKKDMYGVIKTLSSNNGNHSISSDTMNPGEEYNVIASELVKIGIVHKDTETDEFYSLGGVIQGDHFIKIEVRSFEPKPIYNIELKKSQIGSVVLVDLVF